MFELTTEVNFILNTCIVFSSGGPKEYLVVKKDKISTNGEDCDKAGVSYEAFVKQPNRCHKPKGTCLKNQPIDLWRQDIVVQLLNERQEVLAKRRIRIEKGDRCLCLWHCLCACFAGAEGVQCHPMTTEEYRDAGFRGCLPVPTAPGESTLMHFMFLLATFFVMLLFLGKCIYYTSYLDGRQISALYTIGSNLNRYLCFIII
ncbi:hypothetical protein C0J52_11801 [Blattella germanica]|nr:hypothetical protein C0J52_11801 [Blattella germanica]